MRYICYQWSRIYSISWLIARNNPIADDHQRSAESNNGQSQRVRIRLNGDPDRLTQVHWQNNRGPLVDVPSIGSSIWARLPLSCEPVEPQRRREPDEARYGLAAMDNPLSSDHRSQLEEVFRHKRHIPQVELGEGPMAFPRSRRHDVIQRCVVVERPRGRQSTYFMGRDLV